MTFDGVSHPAAIGPTGGSLGSQSAIDGLGRFAAGCGQRGAFAVLSQSGGRASRA